MEIVVLALEEYKAIRYVYNHAISSKISFDTFNSIVMNSPIDNLPEFYVLKCDDSYVGYLLLFANSMREVPTPFSYLACHNGDELSYEHHCELLRFAIKRAIDRNYDKLGWLMINELLELQSGRNAVQ